MAYILAIDLGTTQMKLMILDERAYVVASVSEKYPTISKKDNWMEQNPKDWENALHAGIIQLKKQVNLNKVEVITFSGHMSGVVLVDEKCTALYPCIILSDSRSQRQCDELTTWVGELVKKKTGNTINNAFSMPKLLWLKEEEQECYKRAVAWVSPKDYVRYCLIGKIATEYTDAYNSLCVNLETLEWDREIIEKSRLDIEKFPPLYNPFEIVGKVTKDASEKFGLKEGIPVTAGAADMACATLGMGLVEDGDTALTLGTCATFFTIVSKPDMDRSRVVTFHPSLIKGKMYALGSHMNGGAAVNWISALLSEDGAINYELISELSKKAGKIPVGSNGLLTIPFLVGSGSPYFCSSDRQHMIGMKINTTREEVFRSQIEGVTYNLRQTLMVFREMTEIRKVALAGGGIHVHIWPKIISDVFGMPVELFHNPDVSTLGAGLIGGTAIGMYKHPEKIIYERNVVMDTIYPNRDNQRKYQRIYDKYLEYYEMMHRVDLEE